MWPVKGKPVSYTPFEDLDPVEVLYEFDGPRIFTVVDQDNDLNLAYWSDHDDQCSRFVVVPTTQKIVDGLKGGQVSVFDALDQPRCWLCDIDHDGAFLAVQGVAFDEIPRDALPAHGTMLLPSLEPFLTLRATGDMIVPGKIPGSAISALVEGTQKAFKYLSEHVLGNGPQRGRPDEFTRKLFDLPAQRVAFRSLEISFRMPIEQANLFSSFGDKTPERETLEKVAVLLNRGLNWLSSEAGEAGLLRIHDRDEGAVMLRALREITPSTQGSITNLELSGQAIEGRPVVLPKDSRKRVTSAIRNNALEPARVEHEGRIRELDKDRLSFELREIRDKEPMRFVFDEELLEEVAEAFHGDERVIVTGMTFPVKNVTYALAVFRVQQS